MPDRCEVTRPSGSGTTTGISYTSDPGTVLYRGPCRVQVISALPIRERQVIFGDMPTTERIYAVALPSTVTTVEIGDSVTVLTTPDGALVNRTLRVVNIGRGSFTADRYVLCNDPQEI